MHRLRLRSSLAVVFLLAIGARPAAAETAAAQVEKLEREWSAAFLRHDVAAVDRILAEDFVGIDGRGFVSSKKEELDEAARHAPGDFEVLGETLSEVRVRVYGNTAIVNAINTENARFKGEAFTPRYRRTTVWVRRGGRWQCVSFHASRIIEPKGSGS